MFICCSLVSFRIRTSGVIVQNWLCVSMFNYICWLLERMELCFFQVVGELCVFVHGCACTTTSMHLPVCVCINQLSPPPSLPVVYGSPVGSHISLPFDGDTHDSWLLGAVCFHYASSSARCSFITVTCNASTFGPEWEERISRGEVFWH